MTKRDVRTLFTIAALASLPRTAAAQTSLSEAWTMEAVVSGSTDTHTPADPFFLFDATLTGRLHDGLDIVVRPYAHRLSGGDWTAEMYQLQLRYVTPTRVPVRVEAGILSSPLGLNTLELLPSKNPTISAPFFYFAPLPRFDTRYDGVQLMSGGYPLGVVASSSGTHWDARIGITDQSPTRRRNVLSKDGPPSSAQFIAGGGYTPFAGLRVGASLARGQYREPAAGQPGRDVAVTTFEGEYEFGYTRLSGEWIHDQFETTTTPAVARGFSIDAMQTLTGRWFLAGRINRVAAPVFATLLDQPRQTADSSDVTLGYRLRADFTLRAGYQTSRWYGVEQRTHGLATSVVWARRWR